MLPGNGANTNKSINTQNNEINKNLRLLNTNICCLKDAFLNPPPDFKPVIRCNPSDNSVVIGAWNYDGTTWILDWFNVDGSPYVGSAPVQCSDTEYESDSIDICVGGQDWVQWSVKNDGEPTGVTFYTNMLGALQPAPSSFTKGKCERIIFNDACVVASYSLAHNTSVAIVGSNVTVTSAPVITGTYSPVDSVVEKYIITKEGVKYDLTSPYSFTLPVTTDPFLVRVVVRTYRGAEAVITINFSYDFAWQTSISLCGNHVNTDNPYDVGFINNINYKIPIARVQYSYNPSTSSIDVIKNGVPYTLPAGTFISELCEYGFKESCLDCGCISSPENLLSINAFSSTENGEGITISGNLKSLQIFNTGRDGLGATFTEDFSIGLPDTSEIIVPASVRNLEYTAEDSFLLNTDSLTITPGDTHRIFVTWTN
jgi:hypothetical protein